MNAAEKDVTVVLWGPPCGEQIQGSDGDELLVRTRIVWTEGRPGIATIEVSIVCSCLSTVA